MSSILKALRKLEEEKTRLGDGGVDIARDILKRSARRQDKKIFWPLLSMILLLLLVGTAVFIWSNVRTPVVVMQKNPVPTPLAIVVPPIKEVPVAQAELRAEEKVDEKPAPAFKALQPSKQIVPVQAQAEPEAFRPNGAPFLKLSGIAYREKSEERMAIINDLPVMQGTAIEGAQLIKIMPDRVVLSWKGAQFSLQVEGEN